MPWLAFLALVLWLPVVFYLFERYPTQKAIVFSFISAWLFLPPTQIPLPGFPDWSKMTATVTSVMLCVCLKHSQRLFAVRPRWYDVPVACYCVIPFIASVQNGLGAYDGLSAMLDELFRWGLPYLIGRAFLTDVAGNRQLCLGIAAGGILYIPLCLLEIRMSPQLKQWVYGFGGGAVDFGLRYGGYRPMVFLSNGLELGWWMCCATLAGYLLWTSGAVKRIQGYPMGPVVAALSLVTVACKSTGALIQLTLGIVLIYASRTLKSAILVWALIAIPPLYCVTRPLGLFTGETTVAYVASIFGAERAQSLGFRFENEEILMSSALGRPIFGWGRSGGFNPPDKSGKTAVTDGLWIIVFGWMGSAGLVALNAMILVPTARYITRFRPKTWLEPDMAPVTMLAMILPLFMLDNLSNAMLNPIYAIAMGSVAGFSPGVRAARPKPRRDGGSLADSLTATAAGPRSVRSESPRDRAAEDLVEAAQQADARGDLAEAQTLFEQAIQARLVAIRVQQTPARLDQLARTHVLHARFLTSIGHTAAAIDERERALAVWQALRGTEAQGELAGDLYATNLNDLAWLLISDAAANPSDQERGLVLVQEAVQIAPGHAPFWNTLGIACYRRGDHYKAIHALSRAVSTSPEGGNAFDFFYLALANQALGFAAPAANWLDRAENWADHHPEFDPMLDRVRGEVQATLHRQSLV